jgi:hypothetical protein
MVEQHNVCLNCANIIFQRFITKKRKSPKNNNVGLEFFRMSGKEFCKLCDLRLAKGYWKEISDIIDRNQHHPIQEMCSSCLIGNFLFDFLGREGMRFHEPIQEIKNAKSMIIIYEHSDEICKICKHTRQEINLIIK